MTKPAATLSRATFVTSREHEFFTEKELTMQFGAPKLLWPLMTVNELIDNSLDAAEATDVPPEIAITLEPDSVTVADNGPGCRNRPSGQLSTTTFGYPISGTTSRRAGDNLETR